jgi:hypothetical protein
MNRQVLVKWASNKCQMEFGIGMDIHSGCCIQYSIDDVVFDLISMNLLSTINLILQEHKYSNIMT